MIWGTTWFAIKLGLQFVAPIADVGLRFLVAGALMFAVALGFKRLRFRALPWRVILVFAVALFGANYILVYVSETHLPSSIVAVLFGIEPFFVFAAGYLIAGERTTAFTWVGAAIALGGVAAISLSENMRVSFPYVVAAVGSAAIAAVGIAYAKRKSEIDPLVTLPYAMAIAGAAMLAAGLAFERHALAHVFAPVSLASLLYLAIFGSCVAFFLSLWLLQRISAATFGLSALITPVIAIFVGITFGREHVSVRDGIGAALVIVGVWIALRARPEILTSPAALQER
jgi:drug/metabolite transporter (DMT)-like permease